jgi:hypothetical protein
MYCPRCAAQNTEDANYCRKCGSNLGLVSQALSGRLPTVTHNSGETADPRRSSTIQRAIRRLFTGLAFLVIAVALGISGRHEALWLLFPAFILIGKAIAQIASVKYGERPSTAPESVRTQETPRTQELGASRFSSAEPHPPSITEGTTRIFEPERSRETARSQDVK